MPVLDRSDRRGYEACMRCTRILWLAALLPVAGCASTSPSAQNRGVAPPLSTPSPYAPGQIPPAGSVIVPPGQMPPGGAPVMGMGPQVQPSGPEHARVLATAARLYQANPWLPVRPNWVVSPNDTPGLTTQGDSVAIISAALVRSSSDGQLAAAMSLQLGDLMALRQYAAQNAVKQRRETSPPPDYFQQRDGMASTQASLELAEIAKYREDPRDLRRKEWGQAKAPPVDATNCARQILGQAGFSVNEVEQVGPLLQRYPLVRSGGN